MDVDYTITSLISSVKRRCSAPTAQQLFQNTDFASLLSEEMQSMVVPVIMAEHQDYFVHTKDYTIDGSTKGYLESKLIWKRENSLSHGFLDYRNYTG